MKIKITHLGTTVEIDENTSDKSSINYNHDTINRMVTSTIESITNNQPTRPEHVQGIEIDATQWKTKQDPDDEHPVQMDQIQIQRDASECLRALNYWDDFSIVNESGKVVHERVQDSNAMKLVKSFLEKLSLNLKPKQ